MAEVEQPKRLLPSIAADVALWFPELGGRSIAVSEAQISKQNLPTLPLVMVSLARQTNQDAPIQAARHTLNLMDRFVIEFWLEPARIHKADGTETPFWAYYDYEAIRDRLLAGLTGGYLGPNSERISYFNMTMESDAYAVTLAFTFNATYQWCVDAALEEACKSATESVQYDGIPITPSMLQMKICAPRSECVKGFEDDPNICDPCQETLDKARQRELDSRPERNQNAND